jgi:hypothetical protein
MELKCKGCEARFEKVPPSRREYCTLNCRKRFCDRNRRRSRPKDVVSWRKRTKAKAIAYKGGKCQRCGYGVCIRALKFHHLDPAQKIFGISGATKAWDKIKIELDKCVLVCGNCHDEIHSGLVDPSLFRNEPKGMARGC